MSLRKKESLHQQVIHELGSQIIGGTLGEGDRLPNAEELSDELGVSRTVTREALRVLEEKGLVRSRPKTGIQVQPQIFWKMLDSDVLNWHYELGPNPQFIRHLMQMRRIIEPAAAQLAAQNATQAEVTAIQAAYERLAGATGNLEAYKQADREYHAAIFAATHNPLLAHLARTINVDLDAGRDITATIPSSLIDTLPIHQSLVDAIRRRDPQGAYAAAAELVDQITGYIEQALAK